MEQLVLFPLMSKVITSQKISHGVPVRPETYKDKIYTQSHYCEAQSGHFRHINIISALCYHTVEQPQ